MPSQHFTLEEASQLLPWLRKVFDKMAPLRAQLRRYQEELKSLLRKSRGNGGSSTEQELVENQKASKRLTEQLEGMVAGITQKGIVVRDMDRGLVDFPALREGREVCLCWLLEEDEIRFWHDMDVGFAGRQPL